MSIWSNNMNISANEDEQNTHSNNMFCTRSRSEHTKDASATSNIEDNFVFEEMLVVNDGIAIRACPDRVLQHFLVYS
jgi:hypothetical protein